MAENGRNGWLFRTIVGGGLAGAISFGAWFAQWAASSIIAMDKQIERRPTYIEIEDKFKLEFTRTPWHQEKGMILAKLEQSLDKQSDIQRQVEENARRREVQIDKLTSNIVELKETMIQLKLQVEKKQ